MQVIYEVEHSRFYMLRYERCFALQGFDNMVYLPNPANPPSNAPPMDLTSYCRG